MKTLVLIPARYNSTRFPGKPLAKLDGVEMIIRVCRQVEKTGFQFAVATDSDLIHKKVKEYGFRSIMTSSSHKSGTERVAEAYRNMKSDADVVINVQGDEPFINPEQILKLSEIFLKNTDTQIATLAKPFDKNNSYCDLENPNIVKIVMTNDLKALYFSRSIIPFIKNGLRGDWPNLNEYFTHIGIYGYKAKTLEEIVKLPPCSLEIAENLEQLRWLQSGFVIRVDISPHSTIGIDTPEDLKRAEEFLRSVTL